MIDTIRKYVNNKKVLILGFGREGKSTLALLKEAGGFSSLAISDRNPQDIMEKDVLLICGEDYQKCLNEYDVIFKSPGIVLEMDRKDIRGQLLSQTEVFFERYRSQIIGITGTKGKSTTTTLLHHILKSAGKNTVLAGNIGIPAFDIIREITDDTIITFEMSSHQLEYMTVAPKTAVYLNIHEEHLDHYGTMEKYVAAKENIYKNQVPGDRLFVNELIVPGKDTCASDVVTVGYKENADIRIEGNVITYGTSRYVIPVGDIRLLGEHNYYNIATAYGVTKEFGVTDEEFTRGLCSYETLPHRLQYIGTVDGVKYYDDSISTICDTAIQALNSVKDAATILIGGMDRGIDYGELIVFLSSHDIPNIILMEATGRRIYDEINLSYADFRDKSRLHLVGDLKEAVALAKSITPKGAGCVMSPAAASYGIFKNFEERGEVFNRLVHEKA
ncbi:MAG: UDP-N-acetylmuramoyl-L-alanine--D-glutamate ligase [Thermoflexaceae bacterium]|nr:UDP-N-acetylmuramoyl-L-alanine--D-glutamate ligase [Thermoflexaceae bacterium]